MAVANSSLFTLHLQSKILHSSLAKQDSSLFTLHSSLRWLTLCCLLSIAVTTFGKSDKKPYPGGRQYVFRITLRDKAGTPYSLSHPTRWLSHKSIERRRRQGLPLDSTDLPLSSVYLKVLRAQRGMNIVGRSRWHNTVLMRSADSTALRQLTQLEFVTKSELVWISPDSIEPSLIKWKYQDTFTPWDSLNHGHYGNGTEQIETLNGHQLHNTGYRGKGMTIAVLDGGFRNVDRIPALMRANIVGTHDFVSPIMYPDADSQTQDALLFNDTEHGTKVLSVMAANEPQVLVGTAPEARYWLLRCEDQASEQPIEEDYWTMAAEFADSAGVDIINSSLGYNDYDPPHRDYRLDELDGSTAFISQSASLLTKKGIILVNSAGNTGMGAWKKICVPADAHQVLTVGALNGEGKNAPFSSVGPTQDGRVKPDVMAIGSPTALISGRGTIVRDMGTSFSTPVVAGLVACLWQALPQKSALDIISLVRKTADNHLTPNNVYGYGRPDFWRAFMIGKLDTNKTN